MMITRCGTCHTAFRVSRSQLETRGGKVRCGHCASVFDARVSLCEEAGKLGDDPIQNPPPLSSPPASQAEPMPDAASVEPLGPAHITEARERAVMATGVAAVDAASQQAFETAPDFGAAKPARQSRSVAWLGAALLLMLLVVQLVYHFRGDIAYLFPETKPQLAKLCELLVCELPLPKQPQLMSIETSDLQADAANPAIMVLSATLRNRAGFAQSLPALELTLTDGQDQPLARRVLWARDYLGANARAEPGFAANTELGVKVYVEAAALKATGYRLYLFFP